jgi:hypothetical protein
MTKFADEIIGKQNKKIFAVKIRVLAAFMIIPDMRQPVTWIL